MVREIPPEEVIDVDLGYAPMTFVRGCAQSSNHGAVIISIDELFQEGEEHSVLTAIEPETTKGIVVDECCSGVAAVQGSDGDMAFLGDEGGVWLLKAGQFFELCVSLGGHDLLGPMRNISADDSGDWIAVGAALQVYRSKDGSTWTRDTVPFDGSPDELALHGLEASSSFEGGETYAVGWRGDLYRYYSGEWMAIPLSTNLDLYDVYCAPDGYTYICGEEGTIFKGRGDRWDLIENSLTDQSFWSVAQLEDRVFVASDLGLYEIVKDQLIPARYIEDDFAPTLTNKLSSNNGVLWSIGGKQLFQFDGKLWDELYTLDGA